VPPHSGVIPERWRRPAFGQVRTTIASMDERFCRSVEERFARERPLRAGGRWKADPFEPGWVAVIPTGPSPYAGGYSLVRERDGAVAGISSNLLIHGEDETRAVIHEIGATASADEIEAEIRRRTEAGRRR
jgi:hypothetical protein